MLTIGHVALNVKDMDKAKAFYCDLLGFTQAFALHRDDGSDWIVYLNAGHQFIELFYGANEDALPPAHSRAGFHHLCLQTDDIQALYKRVCDADYPVTSAPKQGKDHNWQFWVRDPDGVPVEFMQLSPDSPQVKSWA